MAVKLTVPAAQSEVKTNLQQALAAAQCAEDNRGQEVVILDLRDQTAVFDFFVIATGSSQRQLRAMSDAIDDVLQKEYGHKRLGTEGYKDTNWILLDYGSIVIHLFDSKGREYYRLEELWGGAKRVPR